MIIKGKMFKL